MRRAIIDRWAVYFSHLNELIIMKKQDTYQYNKSLNYNGAISESINLSNGYFENCQLSSSTINMAQLQNGIYVNCNFDGATMQGARFDDSRLIKCTFRFTDIYWASIYSSVFVDCTFIETSFRGASMYNVHFVNCDILDCDFGIDNLGGTGSYENVKFVDGNIKSKLPIIDYDELE
jgi:uncharacterized protein YjbI with pentapeptide repeats